MRTYSSHPNGVDQQGDSAVGLDPSEPEVDAKRLVAGDMALIQEYDRIAANVRLLSGAIEVNKSALTQESVPALQRVAMVDGNVQLPCAHERTQEASAP